MRTIHTHIIAHAGPTNAQMKPRSVDSQQLKCTTTIKVKSQETIYNDLLNTLWTRRLAANRRNAMAHWR